MKPSAVSELARTVLAKSYDNPKPTPEFHEELWELCCLDHDKVAISAPRGHAKTTAITGSYLISKLVFRESVYALLLSDTEEQASQFIGEVKREFQDNEDLKEIFGVRGLAKDSQTDIIVDFIDGHQCRVFGRGAEQKIRGTKWKGRRPDLILTDDLENEELTDSDSRREKLQRWFYGSVLPAGGDNCQYRIVGTVLHFSSLLEGLMPQPRYPNGKVNPNFVTEDLRDYDIVGVNGWISAKYRAHTPEFEKILWEEKFPEQRLRAIRADYLAKGIPEVYAQEYLNQPLSDDNAFFEKRDFREFKETEDYWSTYAAADLAISARDKAAYTVIVVGKMGPDGRIYVVDLLRGRWDSYRIIEECFAIQKLWSPEVFWIESENIQRTLGPIFEREMLDRHEYINIEGVTPTRDKQSRARPLQARMRAGAVLYDKEAEWFPDLEQEMRRFPRGPYADQVDAMSLLCFGVDKMSDPKTQDEIFEDEYVEEYGDVYFGRDAVTGY